MRIVRTDAFVKDEVSCLKWSLEQFGEAAGVRYARLLDVALKSIAEDPQRFGSREFEREVRLFHLKVCKAQAAVDGVVVKTPRHYIAYRAKSDRIEALRLIHDAMHLPKQLRNLES